MLSNMLAAFFNLIWKIVAGGSFYESENRAQPCLIAIGLIWSALVETAVNEREVLNPFNERQWTDTAGHATRGT